MGLIILEYISNIEYIQGRENIVADLLSKLPVMDIKILHTSPIA